MVVGDHNGQIICFKYNYLKHDIDIVFHISKQEMITSLAFADSPHSNSTNDDDIIKDENILVAFGEKIEGIKKKTGKIFYQFQQPLNESVTSLQSILLNEDQVKDDEELAHLNTKNKAENVKLWFSGEFVYNCFFNHFEKYFVMTSDVINHFIIIDTSLYLGASRFDDYLVMLACKDKTVRVLYKSNVLFECETDASVTCLCLHPPSGNLTGTAEIFFGLENGSIGQLILNKHSVVGGWVLEDENGNGCVNDLKYCNLLSNMNDEDDDGQLIVARDNGNLDVFKLVSQDASESALPYILCNEKLTESITSVDVGYITGQCDQDIVVSTYSGKIISFQCNPQIHFHKWNKNEINKQFRFQKNNVSNAAQFQLSNQMAPSQQLKMKKSDFSTIKQALLGEISEFERELNHKKSKYQQKSRELIAIKQQFLLKDSLKLIENESCYLLSLEIGMDIELVAIKSNVGLFSIQIDDNFGLKTQHQFIKTGIETSQAKRYESNLNSTGHDSLSTPLLMLLDDNQTLSNNCFVFHCDSSILNVNQQNKNKNNQNTKNMNSNEVTRFTWKFGVLEGVQGEMTVYISSNQMPKTCQSRKYQLQSLSLHSNIYEIDNVDFNQNSLPMNFLSIQSDFTVRQFNNWLKNILPQVSERIEANDGGSNDGNDGRYCYNYVSTFVGSYLQITFDHHGHVTFKSDNVSVICILQNYLTKYAIENNILLNSVKVDCHVESIIYFVQQLMSKKLQKYSKIYQQHELIDSLKEILSHEDENEVLKYLSDDYQYITKNEEQISTQFETSPKILNVMKKTIWFAIQHYNQLRNIHLNKNQVDNLIKAIDSCNPQHIVTELKAFVK